MPYQVRTQVFEGPFDLLLHLISKRELDIYDVSLAAITEEYLDHLKQLQELDLEVATEFLVVAATLIEMKASRLLPGPPHDDDELDVSDRDLLIARLLEYRAFKEAAAGISSMLAENVGFLPRTAGPGAEFAKLAPDLMARVSAERFAEIAARVLGPKPVLHVDVSHITPIRVSVAEAIEHVRAELRKRKTATFRDLSVGITDRLNRIVRFLAVLELIKRGEADATQARAFGRIDVRWLGEAKGVVNAPVDEYEGVPIDEPTATIRLDEVISLEGSVVELEPDQVPRKEMP
ncbi:MAG: segregation and condensation protein A [Actinomycetota bacterium]